MSSQQFTGELHAEIYHTYRPDIPSEIGEKIVFHLKEKFQGPLEQTVDVGCGSGQSTIILAPYFKQVFGIDVSKALINKAKNRTVDNVTFSTGPAEHLPFEDNAVQLITACAALHWFEKEAFFQEAKRILSSNGIFVAYTYNFSKPLASDPDCAAKIDSLFKKKIEELHPYFSPEYASSLKNYVDVGFPFEEVVKHPDYRQTFPGTLEDYMGYMKSVSGFQNMRKQNPVKAEEYILDFSKRLSEILRSQIERNGEMLTLYRDFSFILCRKC